MPTVENHTGADVLTADETRSTHTNRGAGGIVAFTLPTAAGLEFFFAVVAAQDLVVTAARGLRSGSPPVHNSLSY